MSAILLPIGTPSPTCFILSIILASDQLSGKIVLVLILDTFPSGNSVMNLIFLVPSGNVCCTSTEYLGLASFILGECPPLILLEEPTRSPSSGGFSYLLCW